ncbi:MAG: CapA family protein [Oscillospiraceae bacterium]|nr:CapA family protein [Oscillospiraceae bacterium]
MLTIFLFILLFSSVFFIFRNTSTVISSKRFVHTINNKDNASNKSEIPEENIKLEREPLPVGIKPIPDEPRKVEIIMNFMGDCTLGTYCGEFTEGRFNETAERVQPEYFFEGVKHILDKGTFNITNCEGVFTDNPLEEISKDYDPAFWFKSPAKNAGIFSANGIDAVGIANNHIGDYGQEGINDTIKALEQYGVKWSDNNTPVLLEHEGIKIVLFCVETWNDVVVSGELCTQIQEYSETTDLQIVFFHGGTEKIHTPDPHKIEYAHQFVDAGADLVIGSHPHVLQPIEIYNDVTILYSLGNFVYGGNTHPENRTIVYTYTFSFENGRLISQNDEIHPCYIFTGEMNAFQPTIIDDEYDRQAVLDFMNGLLESPL